VEISSEMASTQVDPLKLQHRELIRQTLLARCHFRRSQAKSKDPLPHFLVT